MLKFIGLHFPAYLSVNSSDFLTNCFLQFIQHSTTLHEHGIWGIPQKKSHMEKSEGGIFKATENLEIRWLRIASARCNIPFIIILKCFVLFYALQLIILVLEQKLTILSSFQKHLAPIPHRNFSKPFNLSNTYPENYSRATHQKHNFNPKLNACRHLKIQRTGVVRYPSLSQQYSSHNITETTSDFLKRSCQATNNEK